MVSIAFAKIGVFFKALGTMLKCSSTLRLHLELISYSVGEASEKLAIPDAL
jgi:hypothetical protein